MRASSHALVLGAAIALLRSAIAPEARAGGTASLKSCAASLKAVCGGVKPGGGRAQACFASHLATLSEPARAS
jgi:hypothetical protein